MRVKILNELIYLLSDLRNKIIDKQSLQQEFVWMDELAEVYKKLEEDYKFV